MTANIRASGDPRFAAIAREIKRVPASRWPEALNRILDLYVEAAIAPGSSLNDLFDAILTMLSENLEQQHLAELSRRLAGMRGELPVTTRNLARRDEIAIAQAPIEKSRLLTEDDLVEIARTKSESHLLALSRRGELSTLVTDAVIKRGQPKAIIELAANPGARISDVGFVNLVQMARGDSALGAAIAARPDLPDELKPFVDILVSAGRPAETNPPSSRPAQHRSRTTN